ncbi:glutamine cyclotransferase [Polaribacter reichenbachii]|uniref:Glutamine cyclotransferase n=1 Tax=Polaribacter reichenbachii TaxID=996801 RepID=A0A1B8TRU5_9FLAO|nr:glutaminyl-peptide cyclotransferase [Polaribacter reichenbachii]APZ44984.1 glutamine cyclotransferase [Polaribacter reichenbachii]AUC18847.1 glutamine cyclotransferase [Polaribacter reichenbachii]OBY62322.1 glutamine cyclotransferase [Polaribacter reichenbachii]
MKKIALVTLLLSFYLFTSCDKDYKFTLDVSKKNTIKDKIEITLKEENNQQVDNVQFFVNGKEISSDGNSITLNAADYGVGKYAVSALAFYPGKTKKLNNSFEIFSDKKPVLYNFEIVNSYPHDTNAFTQGLEYNNGFLYETTGRRGQSTLRKVEIKSGKVLKKIDLDKQFFGEGMTIVNDKVYWLTWEAKKGFVYDLKTFKQVSEFKYNKSKEGWGLTHNDKEFIKSDGSNKIWFLDLETLNEIRSIQAYTNKVSLKSLNELEWVNGKIYANYWQKPLIAIINPKNGVVDGIINLKGLVKEMEKTQKLEGQDDVLNGIAYDKENDRLFVTGKNWGKLFEIKLLTE